MFMWMRNPLITLKKMAAFETSRNHINWTMGSILAIYPTYSSQERTKAILCCHWDLSQHEKLMPPSLNWDGLPIQRHFQNGRQRSEITFSLITPHLE